MLLMSTPKYLEGLVKETEKKIINMNRKRELWKDTPSLDLVASKI